MASDEKTLIDELWTTAETARQFGVTARTIKRYENEPNGLPVIKVGGRNYNKPSSARVWLEAREKRANPRRVPRARTAAVEART